MREVTLKGLLGSAISSRKEGRRGGLFFVAAMAAAMAAAAALCALALLCVLRA
jgi:hypothetical protein